jgi:hypothetical protein
MDAANPRGPEAQAAKPRTRRPGRRPISHLFQVQLSNANLSAEQVERVASAIRQTTTRELLRMDFTIEELAPLFERHAGLRSGGGASCGGGCRADGG